MKNNGGSQIISMKREGVKRGVYILPNLCTTGSLFCGFFSAINSLQGNFIVAAWAILVAGIFDFLDGRIARLTHAESAFGIEFDSLSDLVSFGFAPAVLLYTWGLNGFNRIGWLVAFLFLACGALRLARFNVQSESVEKNWFQGLPIPAAAWLCATTVIFYDYNNILRPGRSYLILALAIVVSLLMVSTIPYRSFKVVHFRKRWSFFGLVLAVGIIFVIAAEPKVTIFALVLAYVFLGIIEELVTLRKSREVMERFRLKREGADEDCEENVG